MSSLSRYNIKVVLYCAFEQSFFPISKWSLWTYFHHLGIELEWLHACIMLQLGNDNENHNYLSRRATTLCANLEIVLNCARTIWPKYRAYSSLQYLKGAGHFCALDRPGPTLQVFSSFLHNQPLDTKVPADLELAPLKDKFVIEETVRDSKWTCALHKLLIHSEKSYNMEDVDVVKPISFVKEPFECGRILVELWF